MANSSQDKMELKIENVKNQTFSSDVEDQTSQASGAAAQINTQ